MTALLEAPPDTGWFEGIANQTGIRDRQNDTTLAGSFLQTAADLNAGRLSWAVTREHTGNPSEIVGWVTEAKETPEGLWVRGRWAPDPVAQHLRSLVAAGAKLGMSITYHPRGQRDDGAGGRYLTDVDVASVAITNNPANGGSFIRAGKSAKASQPRRHFVPVVTRNADIALGSAEREAAHPDRQRQNARIAAAGWIPKDLPRDLQLQLLDGLDAARSKSIAAESMTEGEAMLQARREFDNAYSNGLARTMARLRASR